jgi:hypothetical protein
MHDPYADLYYERENPYRRYPDTCKLCNNGEITAIHKRTGSVYEFMCPCPKGYQRYKNPPGSPVKIAPEWEKATWRPELSKVYEIYDILKLRVIGDSDE